MRASFIEKVLAFAICIFFLSGMGKHTFAQTSPKDRLARNKVRQPELCLGGSGLELESEFSEIILKPDLTAEIPIFRVRASAIHANPKDFRWSVSAGKLIGSGDLVEWDISGLPPGVYSITVTIWLVTKYKGRYNRVRKTNTKSISIKTVPFVDTLPETGLVMAAGFAGKRLRRQ